MEMVTYNFFEKRRFGFWLIAAILIFGTIIICAKATGSTPLLLYELPGTGFDTNPMGQWSVYCGPSAWSSKEDLSKMVFVEDKKWKDPNATVPNVENQTWTTSGHVDSGDPANNLNDAAVLIFQAPHTGYYGIDTVIESFGNLGDPATSYLSIRTAPNDVAVATELWSTSHSWAAGSSEVYGDELRAESELQNIFLTSDSYIFISMHCAEAEEYPTVYIEFMQSNSNNNGGEISYDCGYLAGDINKDCKVNIHDLDEFASNWLGCSDPVNNCVLGTAKTFIHEFPLPLSSNPQGPWSYEYYDDPTPYLGNQWYKGSQLAMMVPDGEGVWKHPTCEVPNVLENYDTSRWKIAGHSGTYDHVGVLVFQCPITGYYSIEAIWETWGIQDAGNRATEYLTIRIAPDRNTDAETIWGRTHDTGPGTPEPYYDDLSDAPRLRNLYLTEGTYIFFSMRCEPEINWYPIAFNRFNSSDTSQPGGQIRCVVAPEPIRFNFSSPISTNPQEPWSLCYADGRVWEKRSDLSLMIEGQVGSFDCWKNADGIYPYVPKDSTDASWWISGHDGQENDAAVMVFECPYDGYYSIDSIWRAYGLNTYPTTANLKILKAPDADTPTELLWQNSHYFPFDSATIYKDNLSEIAYLKNMYIIAGSYIFFSMDNDNEIFYPASAHRFYESDNSGIGGDIVFTCYNSSDLNLTNGIRDCCVNFADFTMLALDWLECVGPNSLNCFQK
ncbi:MAG: hypothetical protein ACYTEL_01005 [Planctomycetota bacterium]|jgi:hypothetical protein